MYALGIHLGSLTTQAIYLDDHAISRRLTELEEMSCYPIPSWIAPVESGSLVAGHAALRLYARESLQFPLKDFDRQGLRKTLMRFDRQKLRETDPVPSRTEEAADILLLRKVLNDLPPLSPDKPAVALTVPDGMPQECQARMHKAWNITGIQTLTVLEDSVAALYHARACKTLNGSTSPSLNFDEDATFLSLIFDEDALTMTLVRYHAKEFAVTAHTVIKSISLLAIRRELRRAVIPDAQWVDSQRGNGALERLELEAYWYRYGEAFLTHCLDAPHLPFNQQMIFHYGHRYLPLIFSPAVLDVCLDNLRQMLKRYLAELVERHVDTTVDHALYTGSLGELLKVSDILQETLGLRSEAIIGQPDTALAHGAALYVAQGSKCTSAIVNISKNSAEKTLVTQNSQALLSPYLG